MNVVCLYVYMVVCVCDCGEIMCKDVVGVILYVVELVIKMVFDVI